MRSLNNLLFIGLLTTVLCEFAIIVQILSRCKPTVCSKSSNDQFENNKIPLPKFTDSKFQEDKQNQDRENKTQQKDANSVIDDTFQRILVNDTTTLQYEMRGYTFTSKGFDKYFSSQVTTSLVFNFSKTIPQEAKKRFIDPMSSNSFFTLSPAIIFHEGYIVLVARIWLNNKFSDVHKLKNPPNMFDNNWSFTTKFNNKLEQVTDGYLIGIPSSHGSNSGPLDPRLFKVNGSLYFSFNNIAMFTKQTRMDYQWIWDYTRNLPILPKFDFGYPMLTKNTKCGRSCGDKNWMALPNIEGRYHFVRDIDPLRIADCSLEGKCRFIVNNWKNDFNVKEHSYYLRGGTPFSRYKGDYYLAAAHVKLYLKSSRFQYYTWSLIMLHTKPYRIVYISDTVELNKDIYNLTPNSRYTFIKDEFFFPVGLIIETPDVIAVSGHVNDHSSVIVRISGVQKMFEDMISHTDRQDDNHGPPVRFCHDFVRMRETNRTGYTFK